MIKFEKVSYQQFKKDCLDLGYKEEDIELMYSNIKLPQRATEGSAGYDIFSVFHFVLKDKAEETPIIPTGIKVMMPKGVVLSILPRSSYGFKHGIRLANTSGIIDSDYYNNPNNEGHILLKLISQHESEEKIYIGDRIAQGIFTNYLVIDDDSPIQTDREGGIGSSGK